MWKAIYRYWPWLLKEIVKSGWTVTRIVLDPKLPISPTLVRFRPGQRSAVGLVTHANSITLTPGHHHRRGRRRASSSSMRLTRDGAQGCVDSEMDRRVASLRASRMMFAAAALGAARHLALALARAALGPTVFDRVLAGNTIGTLAMMLLAVLGFLTGRPEFLDLAIVYGLLNVIGTIAVLKFFRQGDLGDPALGRDAPNA